jgi:succinate dehydrogenase / fumarate reductase cytochrome b subunit
MKTQDRPLSPHLQIYRWQWTMLYSILHRMTGVGLSVGTLLLVWWVLALATGPEAFATVQGFIGSIVGQLLLFGWTWALMYHLGNGIRHLVWDTGHGFDLAVAQMSGHAMAGITAVLTVLIWIAGYALI